MDHLPGFSATLADRYSIKRELGSGGMAFVYLAEDLKHHRQVGLKVLKPEVGAAIGAERFLREIDIAARLNHPHILPLFDSGEAAGNLYYVMPFADGGSLRDKIDREGPMDIDDAIQLARDVSAALDAAHEQGVVHRDIKPENILFNRGQAVVSDFGIARAVNASNTQSLTETGIAVGTPAYMSPEQATASGEIDNRSDVYSLGCVVYEMLGGEPPFSGPTPQAVFAQIIVERPKPVQTLQATVPHRVSRAIDRALAKNPAERFDTCGTFIQALEPKRATAHEEAWRSRVRRWLLALAPVAVIVGVAMGIWMYRGMVNRRWARNVAIPAVDSLSGELRNFEAFQLGLRAEQYVPDNPTLAFLMQRVSSAAPVTSDPPGAQVYYKDYSNPDSPWLHAGVTPLTGVRFPRGQLLFRFELQDYDTLKVGYNPRLGRLDVKMFAESDSLDQVWVSGGEYTGLNYEIYAYLTDEPVSLSAFRLDRNEVSNQEFQVFVSNGGYDSAAYWPDSILVRGQTLGWKDALATFDDRTGQRGPSTWRIGAYLAGEGTHPVGGVSWYEAQAYCRFRNGSLPTFFHWKWATGLENLMPFLRFSNAASDGPVPVGTTHTIGRYGTHDMAGNLREWTLTAQANRRYILGGSWEDASYTFVEVLALDPLARDPTNGIRCAYYPDTLTDDQKQPLLQAVVDFRGTKPDQDIDFGLLTRMFDYSPLPLNDSIELKENRPAWRKERVSFDAAYGDERVIANIYLPIPTDDTSRLQPIIYWPGVAAVFQPSSAEPSSFRLMEFIPRSGRALVYPVFKGTHERGDGALADTPERLRENLIWQIKDLKRTIEYLETREDMDLDKLGYLGLSWGSSTRAVLALATEPRFKTAILLAGGYSAVEESRVLPETSPWNYAPHVTQPVLMLSGRNDPFFFYDFAQVPMFEALGTADSLKKHIAVRGAGHIIQPWDTVIHASLDWLDMYLGPAP